MSFNPLMALELARAAPRDATACRILADYLSDHGFPDAIAANLQRSASWLDSNLAYLEPFEGLTCVLGKDQSRSLLLCLVRARVSVRITAEIWEYLRPKRVPLTPAQAWHAHLKWLRVKHGPNY